MVRSDIRGYYELLLRWELNLKGSSWVRLGETGMSEMGKTMHESLLGSSKAQRGKCKSCGSPLELYELDFRRSTKIMKCDRCGMLHVYRKDIIGKWRLLKAQKPEIPSR
jgi:hypothetical protein